MNISAKKLLLLDGIGALVTATLLSQVLARHESFFGMPKPILYLLSSVALCFAVFSLISHLLVKSNFNHYLKIILLANTAYCLTSLALVGIYAEQLTWWGIAYFFGEIVIVLLLVYVEKNVVAKEKIA